MFTPSVDSDLGLSGDELSTKPTLYEKVVGIYSNPMALKNHRLDIRTALACLLDDGHCRDDIEDVAEKAGNDLGLSVVKQFYPVAYDFIAQKPTRDSFMDVFFALRDVKDDNDAGVLHLNFDLINELRNSVLYFSRLVDESSRNYSKEAVVVKDETAGVSL